MLRRPAGGTRFGEREEATMLDIARIQGEVKAAGADGWLLYDFHNRDAIAYHVLGMDYGKFTSRRWFYWIPVKGQPIRLCSKVEPHRLDEVPGEQRFYLSWRELHESLKAVLGGAKKVVPLRISAPFHFPAMGKIGDESELRLRRDVRRVRFRRHHRSGAPFPLQKTRQTAVAGFHEFHGREAAAHGDSHVLALAVGGLPVGQDNQRPDPGEYIGHGRGQGAVILPDRSEPHIVHPQTQGKIPYLLFRTLPHRPPPY